MTPWRGQAEHTEEGQRSWQPGCPVFHPALHPSGMYPQFLPALSWRSDFHSVSYTLCEGGSRLIVPSVLCSDCKWLRSSYFRIEAGAGTWPSSLAWQWPCLKGYACGGTSHGPCMEGIAVGWLNCSWKPVPRPGKGWTRRQQPLRLCSGRGRLHISAAGALGISRQSCELVNPEQNQPVFPMLSAAL